MDSEPELPVDESSTVEEDVTSKTQSALGSVANDENGTPSKDCKDDASKEIENQDSTVSEVMEIGDELIDEKKMIQRTVSFFAKKVIFYLLQWKIHSNQILKVLLCYKSF